VSTYFTTVADLQIHYRIRNRMLWNAL